MADKASKLLEKIRRHSASSDRRDIVNLFKMHGFVEKHGGHHPQFYHPSHPECFMPLPSNIKNVRAYAHQAVQVVDRLLVLQAAEEAGKNERK